MNEAQSALLDESKTVIINTIKFVSFLIVAIKYNKAQWDRYKVTAYDL